jgi:hypothetical protein
MPETNIIVNGPTRAAIFAALGYDGAGQPPIAPSVEQRVAAELQDQVNELLAEVKAAGFQIRELEKSVDQRDATLLAVAALISAVPDDTLPAAVSAELARRGQRIAMLEGDVRRLGAQLLNGSAQAGEFKAGDLVTCTWPDGETKAPGVIRGDDPETGRFLVEYYEMPPKSSSGQTWASAEQLVHRSGDEPGDPPAEKPAKRTRKKKADEPAAEENTSPVASIGWPAGVTREEYTAWKTEQEALGTVENVNPQEYKRQRDAGLLEGGAPAAEAVEPEPKVAMTVNGVPLDEKLDPIPPHTTAFPNPAAPAEVQAMSRALAEFNPLPPADFEVGEKVAVLVHVADGTVAVGHIDHIPPGGTMARILFLDGSTGTHHRDALRQLAPAPTPELEPEAPALDPEPQLTGVGAGSPPSADDTDFDW